MLFSCPYSSVPRRSTGFRICEWGLRRAKSGAKLSLKDLLEIATILRQMQSLSDWYDRCAGVESTLDDLFSQLAPVPFLLEKLDRSILSEEEIADAASPALAEIRRKIGRSRQKLRDTLDSMMRRQEVQDCLQDNRVTLRDGRFVLPVRAEHRSKIAGLVHDTSATGQTIFIEPIAVVDANNDIRLLELQEAEEIERIIEELCTECGTWADTIIRDIAVLCRSERVFRQGTSGGTDARLSAYADRRWCDSAEKGTSPADPLQESGTDQLHAGRYLSGSHYHRSEYRR